MTVSDLEPRFDLAPADAERGFALSTEIGWNQALADWRYMLAAGDGVGRADAVGRLVASALALPYGRFAWICMVLVAESHRRRGLATELMGAVIERQVAAGRVPGLDATPAGREVYRQIGFRDHYGIGRYRAATARVPAVPAPDGIALRPLAAGDADALTAVDRPVFGADRGALLEHLIDRQPERAVGAWCADALVGYVLARDGRDATQIGPLVAPDNATARALLAAAGAGLASPCYLDAPDVHDGFVGWLKDAGFVFQRPFSRMYLNHGGGFDHPDAIYAIAGPELG